MIWDGIIAWYLFLAGLGAGAFVLAALAGMAKEPASTMKKAGFIIAPIAVAVGTLLLVVDARAGFANPLRFFNLVCNLSSIMSWGVIILSAFLVVSIIDLILLLVRKGTPKALDIVGMVLAVGIAAYTGVLLGDASSAFPLWNIVVLPLLFIVSAASTGFAAVLIVARVKDPDELKSLAFLARTGWALPAVEALLVIALLAVTMSASGSAAAAAVASVANLLSGSYAVLFWIGFVVIGLVFPFCVEVFHFVRGRKTATQATGDDSTRSSQALAIAGECGVLVGGYLLRYLVIMAAVPIALA